MGIAMSYSQASVSNDNPYSESLFCTMKYHPNYPEPRHFESIEQAQDWVDKFVQWYNHEHLHSSIRFFTPNQRHEGEDKKLMEKHVKVYKLAREKYPERWTGNTRNWNYIDTVSLNTDKKVKQVA